MLHNQPEFSIKLENITKNYGTKEVLKGITLSTQPGEILGILGKNGAGKSTLINIMTAMIRQTSGNVEIWGRNPLTQSIGTYIGYAPQDISIYPHLSVEQNLMSIGEIQGMSHKQARGEAHHIAQLLGLTHIVKQTASSLSGGQKRRLHTGMALIHRPRVAFLDEPTVAADVEARNQILAAVSYLAQNGTTVVYTSHYLTEFEALKAHIAILDKGKIVANDSLDNIIAHHSVSTIRVHCTSEYLPHIEGWKIQGNQLELDHPVQDQGEAIAQLLSDPQAQDLSITNIEIIHPSLENAYLNILHEEEK